MITSTFRMFVLFQVLYPVDVDICLQFHCVVLYICCVRLGFCNFSHEPPPPLRSDPLSLNKHSAARGDSYPCCDLHSDLRSIMELCASICQSVRVSQEHLPFSWSSIWRSIYIDNLCTGCIYGGASLSLYIYIYIYIYTIIDINM